MKHSWYRSECKRQKKVGVDLVVAEVAKQQGKRMESGQPISATPRVTAAVHGTPPGGREFIHHTTHRTLIQIIGCYLGRHFSSKKPLRQKSDKPLVSSLSH